MSKSDHSPLLRRVLLADGAISGATGVLMILAAGFLGEVLGVPSGLLRYAGLSLIPFAAFVLYLSTRPTLSPGSVWFVIALNSGWVVASLALLVGSWVAPTSLGYAFIIVQAIAVAGFVELQYIGLQRLAAGVA